MTNDPKEFLKLLDSFERLSPIDYPWGSSQYDSIASTFRVLSAMRVTPIQGARLMGATLRYRRNPLGATESKAKKVNLELLSKLWDGDSFLCWARLTAWDLWTAIQTMSEIYFNISLGSLFPEVDIEGRGPDDASFNNIRLGLLAYLLFYEGIVNDEKSFKGFGT